MKNLKYHLELFFLDLIDRLTLKRCNNCDEIQIDGTCDYCIHN